MTDASSTFGLFLFSAHKLTSLVERNLERRLRAELGISSMQYRLLSVLQIHDEEFNQRAVAEMLGTTTATVSRQIEAARKQGLIKVEVSAKSRRDNLVKLTLSGTALVTQGDAMMAEEGAALLDGISPEQFETTFHTIRAMTQRINGKPAEELH